MARLKVWRVARDSGMRDVEAPVRIMKPLPEWFRRPGIESGLRGPLRHFPWDDPIEWAVWIGRRFRSYESMVGG